MKTKYIKRKYPKFYILAAFTLLCFLAVGYSYINSDLGIEASALTASNRWNIVVSNMQVNSASTYGSQTNNSTGDQLSFNLSLSNVSQSYIIDFDVTNSGTLKGYLRTISYEPMPLANLDTYLEYKYLYGDGTEVKLNDEINPNETLHMKLYINYLRSLPYEYWEYFNNQTVTYGININYYFRGNQKQEIVINNNNNKSSVYVGADEDYVEIDSDESYNFAACYGASAYEENNKIRISYVPGETDNPYCIIWNDLDEIEDYSTNNYPNLNIYLLKDYEYNKNKNISTRIKPNLYLNGKNLDIIGKQNGVYYDEYIIDIGELKIINNIGNSIINLYDKVFEANYLNISGGTYNIMITSQNAAIYALDSIIIEDATINISNTIYPNTLLSIQNIIVKNSTINAYYTPLVINPKSAGYYYHDAFVGIIDSNVTTNNSNSIGIIETDSGVDLMYNTYICNSTINSSTYDINNSFGSVIYSSNSHFNSTAPTLKTPNINTYLIEDDFACTIINQRLREQKEAMAATSNSNNSGEQ